MKKPVKITLISLGSLIGLVLAAVVVALYLALTPARLTSIVNRLADKYVLCESSFEKVDLTLLRTFPNAGLEVHNVVLVNPVEGCPKDTLAKIDRLTVAVNVRDYLKRGDIKVQQLLLDNAQANLQVSPAGQSNLDIFAPSADTTESKPFELPETIDIRKIAIANLSAEYNDLHSRTRAAAEGLDLKVKGSWQQSKADALLKLDADRWAVSLPDSAQGESLAAQGENLELKLDGKGPLADLQGTLAARIPNALLKIAGLGDTVIKPHLNEKDNLLKIDLPYRANLDERDITLSNAEVVLTQFAITLSGLVDLPADSTQALAVDLDFGTNRWGAAEVIDALPAKLASWSRGMDLDAKLQLNGHAQGPLGNGQLPTASVELKLTDGRFTDHDILPYDLKNISADMGATLNQQQVVDVDIASLKAATGKNTVAIKGKIADLLGVMAASLNVKGDIRLPDLKPLLPTTLPLDAKGSAKVDVNVKTNLEQVRNVDLKSMVADGTVDFSKLDVRYDSIFATSPQLKVALQIPAKKHTKQFSEMCSADIVSGTLHGNIKSAGLVADLAQTSLSVGLSDFMDPKQPFALACDFDFGKIEAQMDTLKANIASPHGTFALVPDKKNPAKVRYTVSYDNAALACRMGDSLSMNLAGLSISGTANYDSTGANALKQWNPNLDVDLKRAYISMAGLQYMVQVPDIKFNYRPERCEIASANVVFGNSDFYLSGAVTGLEDWISHDGMLRGDLSFTSNYTNVDDLMEAVSGLGSDPDTLEAQRQEDNVPKEANPFIVPKDVDVTLHTRIKEATAFGNELQELAGNVTVNDGVAILDQIGFVCKAARMQLSALYRTPRTNHIFLGLDFHLLDIFVDELVDMIPYVDTLVPMLSAFDGKANFHLCAETYVNAFYQPKYSTLRGAASISGDSLVVMDNQTVSQIAKLLMLKDWKTKDNKLMLDSLNVDMTVFKKEVEVYPFLLSLNKYQIVAAGRHNLDMNYDYHVELVKTPLPTRLAVDVLGVMPKLNIKLSDVRYAELYNPEKRNDLQEQTLKIKQMIRSALEANVKDQTRTYTGLDDPSLK